MCVCCLQVVCVFRTCPRLYGPIWVRSMSDEGHREQMVCWRRMNTSTHLSWPPCIIQPGLFFSFRSVTSVCPMARLLQRHTTLNPTAHTHTHTGSVFTSFHSLIQPCHMSMRMQCAFGSKYSILFECRCVVRALLGRICIIVIHFT